LVALSRCRWPHPENGARPWISTLKRVGTAWNLFHVTMSIWWFPNHRNGTNGIFPCLPDLLTIEMEWNETILGISGVYNVYIYTYIHTPIHSLFFRISWWRKRLEMAWEWADPFSPRLEDRALRLLQEAMTTG
jgi:hypothetical protein